MTYVKQTWVNGPAGLTPISAARLNHIEDGIANSVPDVFYLDNSEYGADPTGVINSSVALELAVAAANANGGGKVRATPGATYLLNAMTFTDLDAVEIDLHGATITSSARSTLITLINPKGVVIRAPKTWTNGAGATSAHFVKVQGGESVRVVGRRRTGEIIGAGILSTEAHPTTAARCKRIELDRIDCDGSNNAGNLVNFQYTDHVEVTRCSIRNTLNDLIKANLDTKYIKVEHCILEGAGDEAFDMFGGGQFVWFCKNVVSNCKGGVNLKLDNSGGTGIFAEAAWCNDNVFQNCGLPIHLLSLSGGSCSKNKLYDCGQNPDGSFANHVVWIVNAGREVAYEGNEHVRSVSATGVIRWELQGATVAGQLTTRRSAVMGLRDNKFRDSTVKDIDLRLTDARGRFLWIIGNEHYNQPNRCLDISGAGGGTIHIKDNFADHKTASGWRGGPFTIPTRIIARDNVIDRFYEVFVNATGGNFTLTLGGQVTANINAATATAATVQTALEALSNVGANVLHVGGGPASANAETSFLILFNHDAKWGGGATPPTLTATNVSLTGGASSITITPTSMSGAWMSLLVMAGTATISQSGNSWNGLETGTVAQRPPVPFVGQQYTNTGTGRREYWNGTAWRGLAYDPVPLTSQTGTAYTLVLTDSGSEVETTNAGAVTVTIPPNSSTAFSIGTVINLRQMGAGQMTVVPDTGVTLRAPNGTKTAKLYATVSLIKRGTDEWVLSGDATT